MSKKPDELREQDELDERELREPAAGTHPVQSGKSRDRDQPVLPEDDLAPGHSPVP